MPVYKIADLNIKISPRYKYTAELCKGYITESEDYDFSVECSMAEVEAEARRAEEKLPDSVFENLCIYRKLCTEIADHGGFLFHSSTVSVDGEAYMFTAPSGTGKSTHTRMWRELFGQRAVMINDDKPIVRKTDIFRVYGTPWCGKHGINTNISAPIKGVCIIKRGKENRIRRLTSEEALIPMLNQIYRAGKGDYTEKMLSLLDEFMKNTPIYELSCNISTEAARVSYEAMSGKKADQV